MLIRNRFLLWIATLSMEAVLAVPHSAHANNQTLMAFSASEPMRVRVNGLALAVRSAVVPLSRESIAEAVLAGWRDSGHEGMEFTPSDERTVLGRQIGALHETLTLLTTDDPLRTAVVLATQDGRQQLGASPPLPFALPRDMRLVRTIEEIRGMESGVTYTIDSTVPTRESIERVHAALTSAGWTTESRTLDDQGASMVSASRGTQKIMVTAFRGRQYFTVVVEVTGRAP